MVRQGRGSVLGSGTSVFVGAMRVVRVQRYQRPEGCRLQGRNGNGIDYVPLVFRRGDCWIEVPEGTDRTER